MPCAVYYVTVPMEFAAYGGMGCNLRYGLGLGAIDGTILMFSFDCCYWQQMFWGHHPRSSYVGLMVLLFFALEEAFFVAVGVL